MELISHDTNFILCVQEGHTQNFRPLLDVVDEALDSLLTFLVVWGRGLVVGSFLELAQVELMGHRKAVALIHDRM